MYPFVIGISMFLGILGGWMAGVYGGFTPVPNLLMEPKRISFFHIVYAFKNFNFCHAKDHTFFPWLLHERWSSRSR
jgi:phospholipid/cholesterol/gamma-HCH transport system permease protein